MRGNSKSMSTLAPRAKGLVGGTLALVLGATAAFAAGELHPNHWVGLIEQIDL